MKNVKILKFGTLTINGCIIPLPKNPTYDGDIIGYKHAADISIANSVAGKEHLISWIELAPDLYIADRNLINNIAWDSLYDAGFVHGHKRLLIDGEYYALRLPSGSNGETGEYGSGCNNEWDKMMDLCYEDDKLMHWSGIYSWCRDFYFEDSGYRTVRGISFARECFGLVRDACTDLIGWRPVLQRL